MCAEMRVHKLNICEFYIGLLAAADMMRSLSKRMMFSSFGRRYTLVVYWTKCVKAGRIPCYFTFNKNKNETIPKYMPIKCLKHPTIPKYHTFYNCTSILDFFCVVFNNLPFYIEKNFFFSQIIILLRLHGICMAPRNIGPWHFFLHFSIFKWTLGDNTT